MLFGLGSVISEKIANLYQYPDIEIVNECH